MVCVCVCLLACLECAKEGFREWSKMTDLSVVGIFLI